jgi:hypothetical protein
MIELTETCQKGGLRQGDTDDGRWVAEGYLPQAHKPTYEEVVVIPMTTGTERHDWRRVEAKFGRSKERPQGGQGLEQTSCVLSRVKMMFRSNLADPGITHHITL